MKPPFLSVFDLPLFSWRPLSASLGQQQRRNSLWTPRPCWLCSGACDHAAGMRGVEPSWSSWRGRDAVSVTSRCSCKREGRSSLWLQAVPVDTSRCSRRKRGRLSDVTMFQKEEMTCLGLHAVPGGREDVSLTSCSPCTTGVYSLRLQGVPGGRNDVSLTSGCSRKRRGRL